MSRAEPEGAGGRGASSPLHRRRWRPPGNVVFIVLGVLAYLGLRQLPPDNSLARVRGAGTLQVCVPPDLPPFVSPEGDGVTGQEATLVERAAARIGVPVGWNVQAGWGTAPDPVDWGLRPESCDLLAGGIVVNDETRGAMQVLPYARVGWSLLRGRGAERPAQLAVLTNHWGLVADDAFGWAQDHSGAFQAFPDARQAVAALRAGQVDGVLGLRPEVMWVAARVPGSRVSAVPELPGQTLALGMWKNNITLKRVVTAALADAGRGVDERSR
ncbi:amino acid ABC transporter substrate-binding protein, PAAT family [Deinococcus grandis]|uniref:Amino acid ABC transporter substrate-binding protein, PAAT family n=1 Tax=Deinococcus grandis TaxID=57498 RepID=A0A100HJV4_9DEIO|nr:hypothetical protein DEGR_11440 [Deinococcus grandis]GAQ22090.1 amino acid ABC transporter substrate-binding protein, PAAT family [Deinococcus grandis]